MSSKGPSGTLSGFGLPPTSIPAAASDFLPELAQNQLLLARNLT